MSTARAWTTTPRRASRTATGAALAAMLMALAVPCFCDQSMLSSTRSQRPRFHLIQPWLLSWPGCLDEGQLSSAAAAQAGDSTRGRRHRNVSVFETWGDVHSAAEQAAAAVLAAGDIMSLLCLMVPVCCHPHDGMVDMILAKRS